MKISLAGMDDALEQTKRIERGTKALGNYRAIVRSKLPYAWGMEFGRHRESGKLARKAGGSLYISRAIEEVMTNADADISEGLTKVTAPGPWILRRLGLWARRLARKNAPRSRGIKGKNKKRNYRLWKSIGYEVRKQ